MRTIVVVLGWASSVLGLAGLVLHIQPTANRWLVLAASFAPFFVVAGIVGAVLLVSTRRFLAAGVAIIAVVATIAPQLPLFRSSEPAGHGSELTVLQANVFFGGTNAKALVDVIRDTRADIVTVNELTETAAQGLTAAGLDRLLPHRYIAPAKFAVGTGIWSRYPLRDEQRYYEYALNQLSATAVVPAIGAVQVFALHVVPPVFGSYAWADELAKVDAMLDKTTGPAVVGADFNATYDHAQYRNLLDGRFRDAAEQTGSGILRTYPTDKPWPPLVAIDHILVADGTATTVRTIDLPGSDHHGVLSTIRFTSDEPR